MSESLVQVQQVQNQFGDEQVHKDITFEVKQGDIIALIGASGCGKTTLLRNILHLLKPSAGKISVFGIDLESASEKELLSIQKRWGVMFQSGALFSSLTVLENILFLLDEYTHLSKPSQVKLSKIKMALSGLDMSAANKYPSELSGGMKKRAAMARAIALDPELIFLDEPTTGLDPKSAGDLDELILKLHDDLGLTFIMVTHDLDTLWTVPTRILFMGEGRIIADKPMVELIKDPHPLIQRYFEGDRVKRRTG